MAMRRPSARRWRTVRRRCLLSQSTSGRFAAKSIRGSNGPHSRTAHLIPPNMLQCTGPLLMLWTAPTIGLDIAKSVFQVHGVDAAGQVVIRRQLKRRHVLAFFQKLPACLVGIEACASSHHWSRELQALGHTVRLMPPAYVKPYVKRQKNDMADAEAICEAVTRANMRFVPTKTPEQQSGLLLHRTRHLFIRQQTAVINAIRGHLAEFGIVAPVGRHGVEELLNVVADPSDRRVPEIARACLLAFGAQRRRIKEQVLEFDRLIRPALTPFCTSHAREGADGQAVVCPLLRGSSPTRGVAPKQHRVALTPFFHPYTRARALMARQWSARCYGVARQREGSRQNSIGRVNPFLSPLHAREGADGQAVVCPLLRGSSPTRGVAPKQHRPR